MIVADTASTPPRSSSASHATGLHDPRSVQTDKPFSSQLETWLGGDGIKTVGALTDMFGERSFAVTVLFLMFIPALPLPTGGISHIFEAIAVIVAVEMVVGVRRLWIPERLRRHDLGSSATEKAIPFIVRRIRWFERLSRPRCARLVNSRLFNRLAGLTFIGLAVSAALAPPFSGLDTLPAMGAVVIALGLVLADIVVVAIGVTIGTGGVVLIVTVGAVLFQALRHLF
jgi:hypothetical protein